MSARPGLATLPDAELELLVSRALDGDLSPDEERELSSYLAAHPEARARYADTEALVARLRKLPAPEPPFALATRVTSQVSDRSRGLGALGQRFGLYLPPGLVAAGIGILALGGVLAALFGSPRRAEKVAALRKADEGPVHVFFQEAPPAPPRAAAPSASAPAAPRRQNEAERIAADEIASLQKRADAPAEPAGPAAEAKTEAVQVKEKDAVASRAAAPAAPLADAHATSAEARAGFAPEPGVAAPAPALAAESRRERAEPSAARLTIALVSGVGWRLVPPPPPPPGVPADAKYRLVVDEAGRVVRVDRSVNAPSAEMERYLSTLTFERLESAPSRDVDVRVVLR